MNLTQPLFSDEELDTILGYGRISALYLLRFASGSQLYNKSPRTIVIGDRTFEVSSTVTSVDTVLREMGALFDITIREKGSDYETAWRAVRPSEKRWISKEYDRDQSTLRTHLSGVFETDGPTGFEDVSLAVGWFKLLETNLVDRPADFTGEGLTNRITCLSTSIAEHFPRLVTNLKTVRENGSRGMDWDIYDATFSFRGTHAHIETKDSTIVCNLINRSYVIEFKPTISTDLLAILFKVVSLFRRMNDARELSDERRDTSEEAVETTQPIDDMLKDSILRRVEHDTNLPDDCLTGFTVDRAKDYYRVTFTGHLHEVRLYYKEHSGKQLYTCNNINVVETHSAIVVLLAQYLEQLERQICSEIVLAMFTNTDSE